ncbi:MAG: SufD family Fe-S cluster assembly protein [Clostridia bacterium]|nr:SufD family Fe-S cluster assembly protein [Clostridia bacterium]
MATVNTPIAKTFGWLGGNGTEVSLPEKVREEKITLAPQEERTVILENGEDSWRWQAELAEGATLKLIQVSTAGGQRVNDIHVRCGSGARFEWYRVILGGGPVYDNCTAELAGDGSSFAAEIGYRLAEADVLDMNVEAIHLGRKTESQINASGVMSGESQKILRGTIDLRKGCKGAVGNEMEEVLLLDPQVRNRSVPVILCAEEDVVGNHGASIGRLDENLSFYLQTRGLSPEEVERMMAKARVEAVIRKIPDAGVRDRLLGTEEKDA